MARFLLAGRRMPIQDSASIDSQKSLSGRVVAGVFDRASDADAAARELEQRGWSRDAIGIIAQSEGRAEHRSTDETKATQGAAAGAAAGGALGGAIGLLTGVAALAVPGIGPILAAGPLAAALGGAALGAGMGGLVGSFAGLGIPDEDARRYEAAVREGGVFVSARAEDDADADRVRGVLEAHGARAVNSYQSSL